MRRSILALFLLVLATAAFSDPSRWLLNFSPGGFGPLHIGMKTADAEKMLHDNFKHVQSRVSQGVKDLKATSDDGKWSVAVRGGSAINRIDVAGDYPGTTSGGIGAHSTPDDYLMSVGQFNQTSDGKEMIDHLFYKKPGVNIECRYPLESANGTIHDKPRGTMEVIFTQS